MAKFCEEEFRYSHVCTIGIDFKMKTVLVDGIRVRIQIWDTAGQERYRTITKQYYRKGQGVLLVYDITSESSFLNIRKWVSDVSEFGDEHVQTMLVGNKSDREDSREVSTEQGQKLAHDFGIPFFETSAYTDANVTEVFTDIAARVLKAHEEEIRHPHTIEFSSEGDHSEDEGIVRDLVKSNDTKKSNSLFDTENPEVSCCVIL
ncbi:unnamed protein product [Clavelina lepadiformis]|uniref:Uncharacterized protein n=1 Tax=Clavelina lepadiformis TaxID=159417 RepID=A0ABP0FP54_CLALP